MTRLFSSVAALTLLLATCTASSLRAQDSGSGPDDQEGMAPPPGAGDPNDPNADQDGASFQTFYDNLSSQGSWVQTDQYGYVFQPNVSDPDWAPYTDGRWVYTEDGWTWDSEEPWGWATYHYGRWADLEDVGWVWVPGYQWAPAWVSWRYGGGYAGWAPLPPDAYYGGGGYHFGGDVDVDFHIGADRYHFLRQGDLGNRNYRGAYINSGNNINVYNRTTNITNINVTNRGGRGGNAFGGVNAGGPPIAEVNAHASHRVPTMQLASAGAAGRSSMQGNSLAVFAPRINPTKAKQGRPATVSRNLGHAAVRTGPAPGATHMASPNGEMEHPGEGNAGAFRSETPAANGADHPQETHSENAPGTYHPQETHTENAPSTFHPQETHTEAPANVYHPQTEEHTAAPPHMESQEHTTFAPQHQESHTGPEHQEAKPADHPHPAAAPKPAAKPSGGGDKNDNKH